MTAAEELAALEATYGAWITAGCPQSYTTGDGRTVTKASAEWMSRRIDALRNVVGDGTAGNGCGFKGARFRRDD